MKQPSRRNGATDDSAAPAQAPRVDLGELLARAVAHVERRRGRGDFPARSRCDRCGELRSNAVVTEHQRERGTLHSVCFGDGARNGPRRRLRDDHADRAARVHAIHLAPAAPFHARWHYEVRPRAVPGYDLVPPAGAACCAIAPG